jgi:uncharacterized protein (DUF1778 family)
MGTLTKGTARFDARLSKEQKEFFERAAIEGGYRSLTDFIISTVQDTAKEIIKSKDQIILSEKDAVAFFEAITDSKKPSNNLKKAYTDYQKSMSSK